MCARPLPSAISRSIPRAAFGDTWSPLIAVAPARRRPAAATVATSHAPIDAAKPIWSFSVVARMPQSLVTKYGGSLAAYAAVAAQLATVADRFNAPNIFAGTFDFKLTGFEITTDAGNDEVIKPHPNYDFAVVYDESGLQGGWFGAQQAVLHAWPEDQGGSFASNATDGLVHEFGHARGAIDLYDEDVAAANNPINHTEFDAPPGIMTYPYGVTTWDQYSAEIINASGSTLYQGAPIVDAALPPIFTIRAFAGGQPIGGAHIDLYAVKWSGNSVRSSPALSGVTGGNGEWRLPRNPFAPGTAGKPWNLAAPGFLVRGRIATGVFSAHPLTGYAWLPLSTVGAAAFAAPYSPYELDIGLR
jgi:hypothetical protein